MIEDINEANKRIEWYETKYGPYFEKKGLNNWKNLMRWPTLNEWIILILLIMLVLFGIFSQHNASVCQEAVDYYNQKHQLGLPGSINLSNNSLLINQSLPILTETKEVGEIEG